jgi:hypothetical protein
LLFEAMGFVEIAYIGPGQLDAVLRHWQRSQAQERQESRKR